MGKYTRDIEKLIEELAKLPTIGPKSAERMALHLLKSPVQRSRDLAQAILDAREKTKICRVCNYFADQEICPICQQKESREKVICVVEGPQDVIAIENTGRFRGLYHVLWGKLSPLEGTGPEDISIRKLLSRIQEESIKEVIIATSSGREGETTAHFLRQVIGKKGVKVTRIARGIPVGSNIGYIDQATISEALDNRK